MLNSGVFSLVMHLSFHPFELNHREQQNDSKQDNRLRAPRSEPEINESFLIDGIHEYIRTVHRAAFGQNVNLSKRLEGSNDGNYCYKKIVGDNSGMEIRQNVTSGPAPSILALSYMSSGIP